VFQEVLFLMDTYLLEIVTIIFLIALLLLQDRKYRKKKFRYIYSAEIQAEANLLFSTFFHTHTHTLLTFPTSHIVINFNFDTIADNIVFANVCTQFEIVFKRNRVSSEISLYIYVLRCITFLNSYQREIGTLRTCSSEHFIRKCRVVS